MTEDRGSFLGTDDADGHGYCLSFLKKSCTRFLETGCPPEGFGFAWVRGKILALVFCSAAGGWMFIHQSEARLMDRLNALPCSSVSSVPKVFFTQRCFERK